MDFYDVNDKNVSMVNVCSGDLCGAAERRLLKNLMEYYQTLERLVANKSEAIILKFSVALHQIIDVVS